MKKLILFFSFLGVILFMGCGCECNKEGTSSSEVVFKKGLLIPVYFNNDNEEWNKVIYNDAEEVVIINVNDGPGDSVDASYVQFISSLIANGKKPIGYIYTKYGSRSLSDVESDIDKWLKLYPDIEGFFIDEVSANSAELSYYKTIYDYIKSKGDYFIVLNVGTIPDKSYFEVADNVVVFEDDVSKFVDGVCEINSSKSSIIVYGASEEQMKSIITSNNCRYFYITDDSGLYPYDSLPTYFDEESSLLK